MKTRTVTIKNEKGLHTRPASAFVREAARYKASVYLISEEVQVNGKSIMGILMLALSPGSIVTIKTDGIDESEAIEALSILLGGEI